MPPPNRRPADDDGFEVVDDPAPPKSRPAAPKPPVGKVPVAKLLPPRPGTPAPKPKPPAPVDAGFEVVDDDAPPPRPKSKKPAPPPPADDFEVVEDEEETPQSKRKTKQGLKLTDDTEVDDRPKKKGKKKKDRRGAYTDDELKDMEREKDDYNQELMLCAGIGLVGFCLLTYAAHRLGGKDDLSESISRFALIGLAMVYAVIKIPITIVGLMIVGKMCGIEYGTLGSAIRKLAAINLVTDGLYWLSSTLPTPVFVDFFVISLVTFGLFQTLFTLDIDDTFTTVGFLNVCSFLLKWLFIFMIIAIFVAAARRGGGGGDFGPGNNGGNNNQWVDPGDGDPGDEPDEDEPRPKQKGRRR